jgi:hypothetical protein
MEAEHHYKQYTIRLLARQLHDGKWCCNGGAFKSGNTNMAHGFPIDAEGDTKDGAMQHALKTAKERIDSITPTS